MGFPLIAVVFSLITFNASAAQASDVTVRKPPTFRAELIRADSSAPHIKGLEWDSSPPRFYRAPSAQGVQPAVLIKGSYSLQGASLLISTGGLQNFRPVKVGPDGRFSVPVRITGETVPVQFRSVDVRGDTQSEEITIRVSVATSSASEKRWWLSPSLGFSAISYQESNILGNQSLDEKALTGKIALTYLLAPGRWDLGFSSYFTFLPIVSPDAVSARFLGVNVRLGYHGIRLGTDWSLSLLGGGYFTAMFANPMILGFTSVAGPQVSPVLRRSFSHGSSATAYFKFSPVSAGTSFRSVSSREIAGGASYDWTLSKGGTISLSLDAAQLKLDMPESFFRATCNSLSFGAGYTF